MNKILKRVLPALICFGLPVANAIAQSTPNKSGKIIPPSPTAAALGSYGNVPVSFYNGSPNISIPLYDIATVNHNLKIALNYDASGTKVSQDASWVGLGWSLNAGGVISRIVRQDDDFTSHGYYYAATLPTATTITTQADRDYLASVYNGNLDAEPDIYSYNFNGSAGRFVLGKSADGSPVFVDDKNNLDIKYLGNRWVITTGEGYKYYFATEERTQDYTRSASFDMNSFTGVTGLTYNAFSSPTTAWYLDSIVAPTSETIQFSYVNGKSLSLINRSESFCQLVRITDNSCGSSATPGLPGNYHSYDVSRQALTDVYLTKITFANGSVEFNTTTRSDIEYLNTTDALITPSKLDNIVVKNASGVQLKKFSFAYSYFNNSTNPAFGRLKLDSLTENGSGTVKRPPYIFTYLNPNSLPDKYTKAVDHWGYYNDISSNSTLIPTTTIPDAAQSFVGANKTADVLHTFPAYGVLSAMTYPTGGSTQFEYELNEYGNLRGEQQYEMVNRSAFVRANPDINPQGGQEQATFTILPYPDNPTSRIPVTISCSYSKVNQNVSDLPSFGYSNMWLMNGTQTVEHVAGCTMANFNEPNQSPTITNKNFAPGTYKMLVQSSSGWSCYMSISWQEKVAVPLNQRKGAGIRIKTITDLDMNGHQTIRRYSYNDNNGLTSGILLGYPKYDVSFHASQNIKIPVSGGGPSGACYVTGLYTQLVSGSLYPSGLSSKSGIVGYSKVTESLGNNGENGKTEYYYTNSEETVYNFPGLPTVANPLNGKLDSVFVYNAAGNILKKNYYNYKVKETNSLRAIKLFTSPILQGDGSINNYPSYFFQYYTNNSVWVVPSMDKEITFDGTKNISKMKTYYYDNNTHREQTRMDISQSDGSILITKYLRPADYNATGGNSFVEKMVAQHNITPVIEKQSFVQRGGTTKLISGELNTYKNYNAKFFRPDVNYKIEAVAPLSTIAATTFQTTGQIVYDQNYKPQIYFDAYDNGGNILSLHKVNDASETYLWGYQSQYPVAQIKGGDYNIVKQNITQSTLDVPVSDQQLRDYIANLRTQFPAALISTYTYAPLIGMTSETEPSNKTIYYEYDSLGRLLLIKDQNGKILKLFNYNYYR